MESELLDGLSDAEQAMLREVLVRLAGATG